MSPSCRKREKGGALPLDVTFGDRCCSASTAASEIKSTVEELLILARNKFSPSSAAQPSSKKVSCYTKKK